MEEKIFFNTEKLRFIIYVLVIIMESAYKTLEASQMKALTRSAKSLFEK